MSGGKVVASMNGFHGRWKRETEYSPYIFKRNHYNLKELTSSRLFVTSLHYLSARYCRQLQDF